MQHYGYMYTEQVVAKIAADLNLYGILAESETPLKSAEIASKAGADAALIGRRTRTELVNSFAN
jgi:hypothetical protein